MHRVLNARFSTSPPPPPPAPQHTGAPLRVGELVLLRMPGAYFDIKCELRAIDGLTALVRTGEISRFICTGCAELKNVASSRSIFTNILS